MKNLNYLNYFFVGMPITLCLIGIFDDSYLIFGLLSTMLTGLFQVVIGLKMIADEPNDKKLQIYILSVFLFFALWLLNASLGYANALTYCLVAIPPILAIYFSIIIYKKANH